MVYKDVDPIKTVTVFDVQWSNTPEDVVEEVRRLWGDIEFGNDHFYWQWDGEDVDYYPAIARYLGERGITQCLIHWWW